MGNPFAWLWRSTLGRYRTPLSVRLMREYQRTNQGTIYQSGQARINRRRRSP